MANHQEPCRFAAADPAHTCVRYDGTPLGDRAGVCFYEARSQIKDQGLAEVGPAVIEKVAEAVRLHGRKGAVA